MAKVAYIGPDDIMRDWDVSRATAYQIIKRLNDQLHKEHPFAVVVSGKVNRNYYVRMCLLDEAEKES